MDQYGSIWAGQSHQHHHQYQSQNQGHYQNGYNNYHQQNNNSYHGNQQQSHGRYQNYNSHYQPRTSYTKQLNQKNNETFGDDVEQYVMDNRVPGRDVNHVVLPKCSKMKPVNDDRSKPQPQPQVLKRGQKNAASNLESMLKESLKMPSSEDHSTQNNPNKSKEKTAKSGKNAKKDKKSGKGKNSKDNDLKAFKILNEGLANSPNLGKNNNNLAQASGQGQQVQAHTYVDLQQPGANMSVQQFMKMQSQGQGQGQNQTLDFGQGQSSLQKFNQDLNSSHAMKAAQGNPIPAQIQQLLGGQPKSAGATANVAAHPAEAASVQNQIQSILTRKPAAVVPEQPVQEFFMQAQQAQMQNSPPMVRLANALQSNNHHQAQAHAQTQPQKTAKSKNKKNVNHVTHGNSNPNGTSTVHSDPAAASIEKQLQFIKGQNKAADQISNHSSKPVSKSIPKDGSNVAAGTTGNSFLRRSPINPSIDEKGFRNLRVENQRLVVAEQSTTSNPVNEMFTQLTRQEGRNGDHGKPAKNTKKFAPNFSKKK